MCCTHICCARAWQWGLRRRTFPGTQLLRPLAPPPHTHITHNTCTQTMHTITQLHRARRRQHGLHLKDYLRRHRRQRLHGQNLGDGEVTDGLWFMIIELGLFEFQAAAACSRRSALHGQNLGNGEVTAGFEYRTLHTHVNTLINCTHIRPCCAAQRLQEHTAACANKQTQHTIEPPGAHFRRGAAAAVAVSQSGVNRWRDGGWGEQL